MPFLPRAGLTVQSLWQLALPKYAASHGTFQTPPEWNVTTFTQQIPCTAWQGLSSVCFASPSASCLALAVGSHSLPPTHVTKFLFSLLPQQCHALCGRSTVQGLAVGFTRSDSVTLVSMTLSVHDSLVALICPVLPPSVLQRNSLPYLRAPYWQRDHLS